MTGKRTGWLSMPRQLRVDPELIQVIREIASANCRQPNEQILYWILIGIKSDAVECSGQSPTVKPRKIA